jgi:hypothetical protein
MRNSHLQHGRKSSFPWKWIVALVAIFGSLFFFRQYGESDKSHAGEWVSIAGSGNFIIMWWDGKKRDVDEKSLLYPDDAYLSVISGTAKLELDNGEVWLDKNTEIKYNGKSSLTLTQSRAWIEWKGASDIALKHLSIELSDGDIALLEQQRIYSIVYVLKGDVIVSNDLRKTTIQEGERIMVSQSNLVNPGTTLESLSGPIDDSIKQNAFFLARGGERLLEDIKSRKLSWWVQSGGVMSSGIIPSLSTTGKYITILSPKDGSVVTWSTFVIKWIASWEVVKKVSLNERDISITGSGTFESLPLVIASENIDVVYKAFDSQNNLLERGVITLYSSSKTGNATDKLIPKTFPVSDKDFRFVSPWENPYKTTKNAVTVSWSVPKWAVKFITVNNFRLQKFVPYSTTWYYYANTTYSTMKEGFNLYEIRFYGSDDSLLSTQLFTIIKEWGWTLSGE